MGRLLVTFSVVAVLAAAAGPAGARPGSMAFRVILLGKSEVPKGASKGSGVAEILLDATSGWVCWRFSKLRGIDKPTAARIRKGRPRKAGRAVLPFGVRYTAAGCVRAAKVAAAVIRNSSAYYVSIQTVDYPLGAIRGQL